jgi:hypothetical protein
MMALTVELESLRSLVIVFFFPVVEFRVAVARRYQSILRTSGGTVSLLVFSQSAPITDKREVGEYTLLGKEYTDMLTLPPGHFPREHQVCGSVFFLPRRRLTKQFVCHHVRLKWKSDLLAISCGAVERIVASFC